MDKFSLLFVCVGLFSCLLLVLSCSMLFSLNSTCNNFPSQQNWIDIWRGNYFLLSDLQFYPLTYFVSNNNNNEQNWHCITLSLLLSLSFILIHTDKAETIFLPMDSSISIATQIQTRNILFWLLLPYISLDSKLKMRHYWTMDGTVLLWYNEWMNDTS
jgi:hypothetical protein